MLKSEAEGFSVDFSLLQHKTAYRQDEQLLIRLRDASESQATSITLSAEEAELLASSLGLLEVVQVWPADVVKLSRQMRSRLVADNPQP